MVYPEIKIKEKKKSFNLKMKISKEDVEGVFINAEDLTELKRDILEALAYEVDNLIEAMVEDEELGEYEETFQEALSKVSISVEESDEDENLEDETEEEDEELSDEVESEDEK